MDIKKLLEQRKIMIDQWLILKGRIKKHEDRLRKQDELIRQAREKEKDQAA